MTLIAEDQLFGLAAILMVTVAFSFWAETRSWGRSIGAPLLILIIAMILANIHVIPYSAPLYDSISSVFVPIAIPMLLLRADLKRVIVESGPVLLAFVLAAAVTVIGALAGAMLIDLGEAEAQIVGVITASYIGGSLNFVATAEAVGLNDSSIYLAALSADAVGAVVFLMLLMLMPTVGLIRRAMPSKFMDERGRSRSEGLLHHEESGVPFDLGKAVNGIAVSLLICATSWGIATMLRIENLFILVITVLTLVVASFGKRLVNHVESEFEIGTLLMYTFFAAIGAGADVQQVLSSALPILLMILVLVLIHIVLLIVIGKLMKLDLAEVMIASNACILGPSAAAALAAGRGWRELVTPGMLVGLLGYSTATFIGVAITRILA